MSRLEIEKGPQVSKRRGTCGEGQKDRFRRRVQGAPHGVGEVCGIENGEDPALQVQRGDGRADGRQVRETAGYVVPPPPGLQDSFVGEAAPEHALEDK